MHFYDFNIGEYAKKTQHLTNEEDLAYRRLLDMYYDTEKPIANPSLNGGLATLSRRLRVSEQALKNVLDEFFPDGINKHAEEKIAEYYVYIAKQAANGKLGGRPKRTQAKPTVKPSLTHCKPSAKPTLTTNQLPLTTNQEPNKTNAAAFALPDWINKSDWDLWIKSRKKKMIPEQMQAQIDKLAKWRNEGLDYCGALANAALNGYAGLFLPDAKKSPASKESDNQQVKAAAYKRLFGDVENETV